MKSASQLAVTNPLRQATVEVLPEKPSKLPLRKTRRFCKLGNTYAAERIIVDVRNRPGERGRICAAADLR